MDPASSMVMAPTRARSVASGPSRRRRDVHLYFFFSVGVAAKCSYVILRIFWTSNWSYSIPSPWHFGRPQIRTLVIIETLSRVRVVFDVQIFILYSSERSYSPCRASPRLVLPIECLMHCARSPLCKRFHGGISQERRPSPVKSLEARHPPRKCF